MRAETVDADTRTDAMLMCPWASHVAEVESGHAGKAWMCFESVSDYETWCRQS